MERPVHRPLRIEQSPLERARLWVEIVAFLAAGCWAIYTFVYQTKIAPAFLPPHEEVSFNMQRLAETHAAYVERLEVTIHNDGSVDVDTAGLTENIFGARPSAFTHLRSEIARTSGEYGSMPSSAWKIVQSSGLLFSGATHGNPQQHLIMRPGDTASVQFVAVVPRAYRALRVHFETSYDRYPITPRLDMSLVNRGGILRLKTEYLSISIDAYFRV